jgi:hypothetical protein
VKADDSDGTNRDMVGLWLLLLLLVVVVVEVSVVGKIVESL